MLRTSTKPKSLVQLIENGCVARLCVINSVNFAWEALRPQPWLCLIIDFFRKISFTEKRKRFILSWCQCLNGYFDLICACHAPSKWLSRDKSNLTYCFNGKKIRQATRGWYGRIVEIQEETKMAWKNCLPNLDRHFWKRHIPVVFQRQSSKCFTIHTTLTPNWTMPLS